MKTASGFAATLVLALLASTSRAALVDVGNGLINHPAANLTWTADANLFLTMATADSTLVGKIVIAWTDGSIPTLAGDGSTHAIVADDFDATTGRMNWYGARAWINYLNATHYLGYSDWRLPDVGTASLQAGGCTACVPGDGGFAVGTSEWWRLYFEELGGTAHVPIASSNNGSYSLFHGIEGVAFWGNAQNGTTTALFRDGGEQISDQTSVVGYRAWAVRVGQSVTNPPLAPHIQFQPGNPIFPITPYNSPSAPAVITIINNGTGPATISSITASGDFAVTNTCGTSIAVLTTCTATVTFTPTDLFVRTGTLTVNADSVFTTSLTGIGGIGAGLTASSGSVKKGESVKLTWSSSPHAVCVALGGTPDWAGPLPPSGTLDVSSADPGIFTYVISCTDDEGLLPPSQSSVRIVYLNFVSGALDWSMLLALTLALGLALKARTPRVTRRRPAR